VQRRRNNFTLEPLESRLALAGNVTAVRVGDDLVITGDEQANSLFFETKSLGLPEWAVSGIDTTINGSQTRRLSCQPARAWMAKAASTFSRRATTC
jgi:hypothetical protein